MTLVLQRPTASPELLSCYARLAFGINITNMMIVMISNWGANTNKIWDLYKFEWLPSMLWNLFGSFGLHKWQQHLKCLAKYTSSRNRRKKFKKYTWNVSENRNWVLGHGAWGRLECEPRPPFLLVPPTVVQQPESPASKCQIAPKQLDAQGIRKWRRESGGRGGIGRQGWETK